MDQNVVSMLEQLIKTQQKTLAVLEQLVETQHQLTHLLKELTKTPSTTDSVAATPSTEQLNPPDDNLWQNLQKRIKERITSPSYEAWFKPTQFAGIKGNTLIIRVPNALTADWLTSRYKNMVEELLMEVSSNITEVKFFPKSYEGRFQIIR